MDSEGGALVFDLDDDADVEEVSQTEAGLRRRSNGLFRDSAAAVTKRRGIPVAPSSPRSRFLTTSLAQERADREESCMAWVFVMIFFSFVMLLVVARHYVIKMRPEPPPPQPVARSRHETFEYVAYASWSDYETNRRECVQPSLAESEVWTRTGEACSGGLCLNITAMLRTLEIAAKKGGEAYSSMGFCARRETPIPCACAFGVPVRSYLAPKLEPASSVWRRYYLEISWSRAINVTVASIMRLEHLKWPEGRVDTENVTGVDAAQWAVALYILNGGSN
jgi:hypothetical protein